MTTPFDITLQNARLAFDGQHLTADNGIVRRIWRLTTRGLLTTSLRRGDSEYEWIDGDAEPDTNRADWLLRGVTDTCEGTLHGVEARKVEGETRAADHLSAHLTFRYPDPGFDVTWEVRLWVGAPGVWTRLALKPIEPFDKEKDNERLTKYLGWSYGERLAVAVSETRAHARGLYSDTQHRNYDHLPMLKEGAVTIPGGSDIVNVDWANLLTLSTGSEGLTVVKESPKCVNTPHVDTGEFILTSDGLFVTGLGISPAEYGSRPYWAFAQGLTCWAHWTVLHEADESRRQLAVKRFDRARFPFVPDRDGLVMANTWGSGGAWRAQGAEGAPAATGKKRLLREINSCGDLGIDLLQIDNGWNYPPGGELDKTKWTPDPERLPGGWRPIREAADAAGIELGLWFTYQAALEHSEAVLENVRAADLRRLKLDFMGLKNTDAIAELRANIPEFLEKAGPQVGINWDVTEGIPRVGYFFARQWGNLFLSNRENGPGPMRQGSHIQYKPRLALRDAWQLAHVMNLNQLQITIQDKDATPRDYSNAWRYSHAYAVAIALMGLPLFFQETQNLSEAAREEIKPILAAYRRHREAMWQGFTFPIGEVPNDHAWTGFQSLDPDRRDGYLLLFREIDAPDRTRRIGLHFLKDENITCEDVLKGEEETMAVDETGHCEFTIEDPGAFRWLHYRRANAGQQ